MKTPYCKICDHCGEIGCCGIRMKIGDYVRTERGYIDKIKGFSGDAVLFENDTILVHKSRMEEWGDKSSPNLIDLIQRNDFINGWQIAEINSVLFVMTTDGFITLKNYMKERKIKEVLTKEQYEREVYRV